MQTQSLGTIFESLNRNQVRYLIVGGLAVVAHGYFRMTVDVDLILAVDQENLSRAVGSLKSLGYKPRAPVVFESFVNADERRRWAAEKQMKVFSLFSDAHPETEIDLFLEPPFDFDRAFNRSLQFEFGADKTPGRVCGYEDLIELKRIAGRQQDLFDIEQLRILHDGTP
jgi:hypothetical protein